MSRMRVLLSALFLVLVGASRSAIAANEVKAWSDSSKVAVGKPFYLHLQASSTSATPQNSDPGAPAGVSIQGRNESPMSMQTFINGVMSSQSGLTATWAVATNKLGKLVFTPTVMIGGARVAANAVSVTVVPESQAPPQRDPNDPFASMFGPSPFDDFFRRQPRNPNVREVVPDPAFGMAAPRGRIAFLHAVVDKRSAVVGEQVTLSIYIYVDGEEGGGTETGDAHEAVTADFIRYSLRENDHSVTQVGYADIGGRAWSVNLFRKIALFPVKAGVLTISPMTMDLKLPRGTSPRESEALTVRVTEPPLAGRPPGYRVGDVGHMTMEADVTPHTVKRGDAIGVTVTISGDGNLPQSIVPPVQDGLEWLSPPDLREQMAATKGLWGGTRTLSFVVRAQKEGNFDLGSLELPYYQPDKKTYAVARANLGSLTVTPGAAVDASATDPRTIVSGLPPMLTSVVPMPPSLSLLTERRWFPFGLLLPGLLAFAAPLIPGALARMREKREQLRASPEYLLREHLRSTLAPSLSAADLDARTIRALELLSLAEYGFAIRGLRTEELAERLAEAGVPNGSDFVKLIRDAEEARFSPTESAKDDALQRWNEVNTLIASARKGGMS